MCRVVRKSELLYMCVQMYICDLMGVVACASIHCSYTLLTM